MFDYLSVRLSHIWGPFRLLGATTVQMGMGCALAAILTWFLLPILWKRLPVDRGKALVKDGKAAAGKPTGAGVIFVPIIVLTSLIVLPLSWRFIGILCCLTAIMLAGYFDDASQTPWSEAKKGILDLIISLATTTCFCECQSVRVWLPLFKGDFLMPAFIFIPLAGILLFVCINAVNCSDGVDGLAGSLSVMTLLYLAVFLYGVIGHNAIAAYFRVPHYGSGAIWATLMVTSIGALAGYLWFNANPSAVLMGDAGSRFLGMLIGLGALATGNMFLFLILAPILALNGGSGLVKLLLLRALRAFGSDITKHGTDAQEVDAARKQLWIVRKLHTVRFPIHDHCKNALGWSNAQVLMRFAILQAFATPLLFLIVIKLR